MAFAFYRYKHTKNNNLITKSPPKGEDNMIKSPLFVKKKLAVGVTAAMLALGTGSANAAIFNVGDFEVKFDSTFSYGSAYRIEDRDFNQNVGKSNHPSFNWTGYDAALNPIYSSTDIWKEQGTYSNNGDAGNLNFDSGDAFSQLIKGTHELQISKDNFGFFTRFMYFHDFALMDGDFAYSNPTSGQKVDPCADKEAKELVCQDLRLLDAFVYADFDLNDGLNPLSIRLGQQVVNWGESALISHGINVNPVDIDRLKAPGAEVKEAFIPVGMLWGSLGITENVTLEAFYQYQWHETRLPVVGTYYSTNDFAAVNGYQNNIQLGFTSNPDMDLAHLTAKLNGIGQMINASGYNAETGLADPMNQAILANYMRMYLAYPTKVALKGKGDNGVKEPKDSGQYGLKLGMYLPEFNDTELGLYYVNYHSRRPLISGQASNFTTMGLLSDLNMLATTGVNDENITQLQAFTKGILEYPEDIKLYGLSFNTTVGETALAGEFTYRQDEPLQIDDVELLYAGMAEQLANPNVSDAIRRDEFAMISQVETVQPGEIAQGYILRDTAQFQFSLAHLFGPSLGADSWAVLGEAGVVHVLDMPEYDELRLNAPGTGRSGTMIGVPGVDYTNLHLAVSNGPETTQFASGTSWGYRLLAKGDYNNVFAGVNFSPRIVFSHDVNGTTPDPMFLFVEDRKSLGVNMTFTYQNAWSFDFGYNSFWGGGKANNLADRDFVSFNIKYSI